MKRGVFTLALTLLPAFAAAQSSAPAQPAAPAQDVPYAKLAYELETPKLVHSEGPKDKSQLKLRYVADGETEASADKMTSISIAKVKAEDTVTATRSIIANFKANLDGDKRATVTRFDRTLLPSESAFFEFHSADGVAEQGIAYSPAPGYVSVIQIAYKHGYVKSAIDRGILKALVSQH